MKYTKHQRLFIFIFTLLSLVWIRPSVYSQSGIDSAFSKRGLQQFAASVKKEAGKLEDKLLRKSRKVLQKMQRQEEKLCRNMPAAKDTLAAKTALTTIKDEYKALRYKLKDSALSAAAKLYIPYLDSLATALQFLDQNGMAANIKDAIGKTKSLQDKFQQADEIKRFIKERKEQLKEQIEKPVIVKQLKKINKQVFYYAQQINEYKEIFKEPKKIEKKTLGLLTNTKIFRDFMRKNSMLASLFSMTGDPDDPDYTGYLIGLQTRVQVNALIQQQIAAGGPNARAQLQQNLQAAQSELNLLKDRVLKVGGGSNDEELPDFKPNNQKTKSFLQRLEYGANIQTQNASGFFPVTSDIGLSIGYKLNDKTVIGIGASYKMGWGQGWNSIRLTRQGVGLRSYMDWQCKGSFRVSGGYEQNYRPSLGTAPLSAMRGRAGVRGWQQSGLIGISKLISLKTRLFTKTSIKILWDFLSYRQVPKTPALLFRIGYNF